MPVTDAANAELEAALVAAAKEDEGVDLKPEQVGPPVAGPLIGYAVAESAAASPDMTGLGRRASARALPFLACLQVAWCGAESLRARPSLLHPSAGQVTKALQLALACDQRIGVMLVGPSGTGKTTLWRALAGALGKLGRRPEIHA